MLPDKMMGARLQGFETVLCLGDYLGCKSAGSVRQILGAAELGGGVLFALFKCLSALFETENIDRAYHQMEAEVGLTYAEHGLLNIVRGAFVKGDLGEEIDPGVACLAYDLFVPSFPYCVIVKDLGTLKAEWKAKTQELAQ